MEKEPKKTKAYLYPTQMKKLKACSNCKLIKTHEQFKEQGCENCGHSPKTTSRFKGMIAIMDPKGSFLSQKFDKTKLLPGFYCLQLLDDDIDLQDKVRDDIIDDE